MRFAFIEAWKEDWSVEFLCRIMKVTSRGFRAWRVRPMSQRQRDDMILLAHIREQHRLSLESYGRPRMTEELQELNLKVGHRRVGRLMRENGIKLIRTQKYKATTDSDHTFNIAPNLLDQDFSATGPNQKWAGDISYIWTSEGWLYLAVILDLYSRRVIGWAVSNRMKRDLASGPGYGGRPATTAEGLHSSYGSWIAILFKRVPKRRRSMASRCR